jgi:peptide deformylase
MKKIVVVPHPSLRKVASEIMKIDKTTKDIVKELWNALTSSTVEGVGIAAPQIAVSERVFILRKGKEGYQEYINPEIFWVSEESGTGKTSKGDTFLEGCLSIPNIYGAVIRPLTVEVGFTDLSGKRHRKKLSEPYSRYFQHELDHLDGVLFTDHVMQQKGKLYWLNEAEELEELSMDSLLSP